MTVVKLGARSYREDKVFYFDKENMSIGNGNGSWSQNWEKMSASRAKAKQIAGWQGSDRGSVLIPKPYQELEGDWINGIDPATAS